MIQVSHICLPTVIGGALNTLSLNKSKLPFKESSKRLLPPLSTQNLPRFFTAALAFRPKL
jgi:hypothetical protein